MIEPTDRQLAFAFRAGLEAYQASGCDGVAAMRVTLRMLHAHAAAQPAPVADHRDATIARLRRMVGRLRGEVRRARESRTTTAPPVTPDYRESFAFAMPALEMVAQRHQVSVADLRGGNKARYLHRARSEAAYLLRHGLQLSYPEIGLVLGGRDHTTVMSALRGFTARMALDDVLRARVERACAEVRGMADGARAVSA